MSKKGGVVVQRKVLKQFRKKKGLSVQEIADLIGVSASFYYKIEQGIRDPIMEKAQKIAQVLESTVDELFFNTKLDDSSIANRLAATLPKTG